MDFLNKIIKKIIEIFQKPQSEKLPEGKENNIINEQSIGKPPSIREQQMGALYRYAFQDIHPEGSPRIEITKNDEGPVVLNERCAIEGYIYFNKSEGPSRFEVTKEDEKYLINIEPNGKTITATQTVTISDMSAGGTLFEEHQLEEKPRRTRHYLAKIDGHGKAYSLSYSYQEATLLDDDGNKNPNYSLRSQSIITAGYKEGYGSSAYYESYMGSNDKSGHGFYIEDKYEEGGILCKQVIAHYLGREPKYTEPEEIYINTRQDEVYNNNLFSLAEDGTYIGEDGTIYKSVSDVYATVNFKDPSLSRLARMYRGGIYEDKKHPIMPTYITEIIKKIKELEVKQRKKRRRKRTRIKIRRK